jgi:hypothetical protein
MASPEKAGQFYRESKLQHAQFSFSPTIHDALPAALALRLIATALAFCSNMDAIPAEPELAMKPIFFSMLLGLASALSGCGGGNDSTPAPQRSVQARPVQATVGRTASDYETVVQQVYVGYFGRPADAGGLKFFEETFLRFGAPTNIGDLNIIYANNADIRGVIENFGNSQESRDLYPGDNNAFVAALYRNLFSREPDAGGQAFWVNLINTGVMTRARAAVSLMAGAQGTDITVINNKAQVAKNFTSAITTPLQAKGYDGLAANVVVRAMLANVVLGTDLQAFQSTVTSTLTSLANTAAAESSNLAQSIVRARCTPCHAQKPTFPGYLAAPFGVAYDSAAQIRASAVSIIDTSVSRQFMPFGNATNMTDAERTALQTWLDLGAP